MVREGRSAGFMIRRLATMAVLTAMVTADGSAACLNKFVARTDGPRHVVTLLTGKLTFQEAQILAAAIEKRQAPLVEWVDDKGKTVAKQYGELKVVRPMPVGCDGRKLGVVLTANFLSVQPPRKKMSVRFSPHNTVVFDQQVQ